MIAHVVVAVQSGMHVGQVVYVDEAMAPDLTEERQTLLKRFAAFNSEGQAGGQGQAIGHGAGGLCVAERSSRVGLAQGLGLVPSATSVIHLFMNGGPSQVDLFDPKPMLDKYAGKPAPRDILNQLENPQQAGNFLPSPFKFARHGQCGMDVSEESEST